jgi:putative flippase GtrA
MIAAQVLARVPWLVLVGGAATITYMALAWSGTVLLSLPGSIASIIAYTLSTPVSYLGHRHLTFQSSRPHREAAPRFLGVSAFGYVVAFLVPWLLTDLIGAHPLIAIALTCTAVPVLNALALWRIVFPLAPGRGAKLPEPRGGS